MAQPHFPGCECVRIGKRDRIFHPQSFKRRQLDVGDALHKVLVLGARHSSFLTGRRVFIAVGFDALEKASQLAVRDEQRCLRAAIRKRLDGAQFDAR
jgi:hypothetical protein